MRRRVIYTLVTFLVLSSNLFPAESDHAEYIRSHYAKYEYRIPMRDGVTLFTSVYMPYADTTTYPIFLLRTPYSVGPYGADRYPDQLGPHKAFDKEGFIFVFQDVRGRFMSEGEYVNMRPHIPNKQGPDDVDESTDTYDTIEWLLENIDNHNGRVGMWGISYPGFYCSAGMINSHPALKAVSPQAPIADWFWDDMHHHGAFILPLAFNFFSIFGQPRDSLTTQWPAEFDFGTPDGYQFFLNMGPLHNANQKYFHNDIEFWNSIVDHPNYDDFWQSRNILPHLRNISAATMVVGGWFDMEDLYGPLHTYQSIEEKNPGNFNILVMGPWSHGGWTRTTGESLGDADFGFPTSEYYQNHVDLQFFRHILKQTGSQPDLPEALVFETGANRWREFDDWPPSEVTDGEIYLQANGELSFREPAATEEVYDQYTSDPDNPVPYTTTITTDWEATYMTEDQRFAARRPDVLVYQTDVLEADLTLAGPIQANLYVSTSGTASDFIVKVIDVYPNQIPGYDPDSGEANKGAMQQMVRGEVMRGRFRNSYEQPEPFEANEITPVSFELQDILHTFKRGHRLMIQIQSTWFPLVDRNPGTYVPNIFKADAEDFIEVNNRIYRSRQHPSHIKVGILEE
ncbi:MAG TPA: CocE/NonD family hydrolase [bacterium]|nr:CocE/NonD family hydrolase [bacterium]